MAVSICDSISRMSGVSYILGFVSDPVFQKFVHGPAVWNEIDRPVQIVLQRFPDVDEGEQIRLRKFNDDVDIAFRPGLVSREGSEKSEPQYAEPRRQIRLYPAEFAQQCVAIQRIVSHFSPSSKKVS